MSLVHGRPYLAIPGPSVMPDRVLQAMHRPAPNIYFGELVDMVASIIIDLRRVAQTRHHAAIYIANGHGVWEASVANILNPGDRVLVLSTGHFAKGWGEMARRIGAVVETLEFGQRSAADPARLADVLRADRDHQIKAVLAVQVDTATGIRNDVPAMRAALDSTGHPALLMVDCIASLGCDRFEMDAWGVDVMVTASQKGLMTPPGLGFVFFNDKAAGVRAGVTQVSSYWDWVPRVDPVHFPNHFCGTAPTHHLFALRAALTILLDEEGLDAAMHRHARLAQAVWAACDAWGAAGPLEINVTDPAERSHAVTALRIGAEHGTRLRNWVGETTGVTLGIGLGMAPADTPDWHGFFRIGHMGHVNAHMIMGVLGSIQAGLTALDIPHGPGALDAAAAVMARG
ncbi:alanine--glyoxylate aminotransferase family protein [Pseudoruegeria sp. SK021]|uniref:pyridoxal-phosphate-dependent aminotransferase family protein n=1 Tax=Pseudoruegeria sp. SK021 TaxID=1933035 RepID=UPI000A21EE05|nr:aminotransferase class V-fold PLP-dependent enzyme [Pseudoruegeria sp. SK021]OSP56179.1 septum site-determining protein [Pseudoruegeria sp. SK021]